MYFQVSRVIPKLLSSPSQQERTAIPGDFSSLFSLFFPFFRSTENKKVPESGDSFLSLSGFHPLVLAILVGAHEEQGHLIKKKKEEAHFGVTGVREEGGVISHLPRPTRWPGSRPRRFSRTLGRFPY